MAIARPPANNTIKLSSNGVLLIIESGYQTRDSILAVNKQVDERVAKLREQRQPALILADLSRVTGHDQGANNATISVVNTQFDAMAIYGADLLETFMVNLLSFLLRSRRRIRAFRTVKGASRWMAAYVPAIRA